MKIYGKEQLDNDFRYENLRKTVAKTLAAIAIGVVGYIQYGWSNYAVPLIIVAIYYVVRMLISVYKGPSKDE